MGSREISNLELLEQKHVARQIDDVFTKLTCSKVFIETPQTVDKVRGLRLGFFFKRAKVRKKKL